MIKDSELLKLVMERYPEQPFDFILEQFTIFKAGLIEANGKLAERDKAEDIAESAKIEVTQDAVSETETDMSPAPKKKYTRRNLVAKPEEAIGKEFVECCLCGRKVQSLTARHLLSHGISMDEYKKLCGYAPDQKLICGNLMEKLQKNVLRAYNSRKKKLSGEHLK